MTDRQPEVSVVVATHNRAAMLKEHLAAMLSQKGVHYELVYVDDGSTDDTPNILAGHAARYPEILRHTRTENRGPGPARNTGVEMARGRHVVIADDDTFPHEDWLMKLLGARDKHHADVVAYALHPESLASPAERYLHYRNLMVTGDAYRRDYIGPAFFLMRRDLYLESGGFSEERLSAAEDFEFCYRLRRRGALIIFYPNVWVLHRFSADWADVERRIVATAVDGARVYRMLGMSTQRLVFRVTVKLLTAPVWVLNTFPRDLYWDALKLEWIFFRHRIRACLP